MTARMDSSRQVLYAGTLTLILLMSVVLSGCVSQGNNASNSEQQVFRMNLSQDPPSLDPALANDRTSFTVLGGAYEGLTKYDKDGAVVPGIAQEWELSEDQLTYTFHLRDAKWSNGDPVTAMDFEYAWKRVLNPQTVSNYAYILYYVKNAATYNSGLLTDPTQVGVQALDERTLQVTLERPTNYFPKLVSFITYLPVHPATTNNNPSWSTDPSTMITNGPFTIESWKHDDKLVLQRNPHYYGAALTQFNKVEFSMIADDTTMNNLFDDNKLDWEGAPTASIPAAFLQQYEEDQSLHSQGQAVVSYLAFNSTEKPLNNANIRKALAMSIDRNQLVENVVRGGQIPAYGIVPPGIDGAADSFRDEYPDTDLFQPSNELARQLLRTGLQEEGITELPEIELLYNIGQDDQRLVEAIVDMWRQQLGVKVKVVKYDLQVYLDHLLGLDYEVALAGWGADYDDPNSFLDLFTSYNGNNSSGLNDPVYDKLISDAAVEQLASERMALFARAEQFLIQDQMIVIPIYYYAANWRQKEYVHNVTIDALGNLHYNEGYIAQ